MKMRKVRHAIVETRSAHANAKNRGVRLLEGAELRPAWQATISHVEVRTWEGSSRLN